MHPGNDHCSDEHRLPAVIEHGNTTDARIRSPCHSRADEGPAGRSRAVFARQPRDGSAQRDLRALREGITRGVKGAGGKTGDSALAPLAIPRHERPVQLLRRLNAIYQHARPSADSFFPNALASPPRECA